MSTAEVLHQKEKGSALVEVCSVRLAETWFGVPITHILEIVGAARAMRAALRDANVQAEQVGRCGACW